MKRKEDDLRYELMYLVSRYIEVRKKEEAEKRRQEWVARHEKEAHRV